MVNLFSIIPCSSKRRGISSIVGGVIFLVLLTTGFSAFYVAMEVQTDNVNTQAAISKSMIQKTQEKFEIAVSTNPDQNNRLGVQVKNEGPNPVEISNIWLVNKSEAEQPAKKILVDYSDAFIPPGYGADIFANKPLYLSPNEYTVKVVSTLGGIKKADIVAGGPNNLLAEMFTIPPDVRQGENVTIAMRVTNVGDTQLVDVEPHYIPPDVVPLSVIDTSEFISTSPVILEPTESTIFTWHYKVKSSAAVGTKVTFTSAANATDSATGFDILSNNATDKILIRDPQGGSGEEIVIKDELFAKPEIFMIVPNPFGVDDEEALWGISVANPTEAIMYVSKITLSILFAGANDNHKIFDENCPRDPIIPDIASEWDCPNQNQLTWANVANPQPVEPRSVYTFLIKVRPGSVSGGGSTPGLDSVVLHSNVFTSLGSFGKASHQTAMSSDEEALVNVYLSTNVDSTTDTHIRGNRTGIEGGSLQSFNIVLAELNSNTHSIAENSDLIINIPKGWSLPTITGNTGFDVVDVNQFPDDSYQIVANLDDPLSNGGKTITFTSFAPTPATDKMYVMHVLANGLTSNDRSLGPVAEVVLQVCGQSGCS